MNHEEMINHKHNDHLNGNQYQNDVDCFLQTATNSTIKRINKSDTLPSEPMWGPPL